MIYPRSVLHSNQSYHDTMLGATNSGLQSEGAAEVDPSPHGERVRHFSSLRSDSLQMTKKPSPAPVQTPCHRCVCGLSSTAARDRTLSPPLTKLLRARLSHQGCLSGVRIDGGDGDEDLVLVVLGVVSDCIYLARDLHDGDLGLLSDGMIGAPIDFSSSEGNGWVGWTRGQVCSGIIFDHV